jgi:hypothetical protein
MVTELDFHYGRIHKTLRSGEEKTALGVLALAGGTISLRPILGGTPQISPCLYPPTALISPPLRNKLKGSKEKRSRSSAWSLKNEWFSNFPLNIVGISEMQEWGLKYVIHTWLEFTLAQDKKSTGNKISTQPAL